jgi:hypothetical protein
VLQPIEYSAGRIRTQKPIAGPIIESQMAQPAYLRKDGKRGYLEFYAIYRMTNDRHVRIYEDNKCKELDALRSVQVLDPKVSGNEEIIGIAP